MKSQLSDKFVKKWMRLARHIALDNDTPCSRKVGCVITDVNNKILSIGYNGAPSGTPHCDSTEYIRDILWPKLDEKDKEKLCDIVLQRGKEHPSLLKQLFNSSVEDLESLIREKPPLIQNCVGNILDGCNTCPRRLLGYPAGQRTDLCSCQHAERNALSNANGSVVGGILFGWCCISCFSCTGAIANSHISEVHFLSGPEYENGCLSLYGYADIPVFLHDEKEFT